MVGGGGGGGGGLALAPLFQFEDPSHWSNGFFKEASCFHAFAFEVVVAIINFLFTSWLI